MPGLPVDQGAVDVEGDECDVLGDRRHRAGIMPRRPLAERGPGPIAPAQRSCVRVPRRKWTCWSTKASSCSPATDCGSPPGRPSTPSRTAVAAAAEVGYPVVVKAQVLIGGRGKAGGVKLAADEAEVREHAGQHPRHGHQGPHGPHALDRARLGHRLRVLRLGAARPLGQEAAGDVQRRGRRRHRRGRREDAREADPPPRRPARGALPRAGAADRHATAAPTPTSSRASPTRSSRCTRCGCRRTRRWRRSTR